MMANEFFDKYSQIVESSNVNLSNGMGKVSKSLKIVLFLQNTYEKE